MDLRPYVADIQRQLVATAQAGGEDAKALAERLVGSLDAIVRLTLQDALALAADEITVDLAPGSVELRLRGRDPEFVVTPPPTADHDAEADELADLSPVTSLGPELADGDDGGMTRINLRLPDQLKFRVEAAASRDGLSVNSWLVRAASAAVERADHGTDRSRGRGHRLAPSATPAGSASRDPARRQASQELRGTTSMPTFDTPPPVQVELEIIVGDIWITATDRANTVVDISPSDPASAADVQAAEQTKVEYANGRLVIKAPKNWRHYSFRTPAESIDVRIDLPSGSRLHGEAGVAALHCTGPLGEATFRTGTGDISLDEAGPVTLRTGAGDISVDKAYGPVEVTTGSGALRIGAADRSAVVKNSNGSTWIGEVNGDVKVNSANGSITLGRTRAAVAAKTARGDIAVQHAASGSVLAETAFGKIQIGLPEGVAAWLDLHTKFGHVRNELTAADQPAASDHELEVRARTSFGDITVSRSASADSPKDET